FLPGHEPTATLTLTRQRASAAQHFKQSDSWCTATADCTRELQDRTWSPYFLNGANPQCDLSTNACVMHGAGNPTCATVTCATGPHCEEKGLNGGSPVAVCIKDTGGVACGGTTCGAGEYCCSESCGTCAPIGAMCPKLACAIPDAGGH